MDYMGLHGDYVEIMKWFRNSTQIMRNQTEKKLETKWQLGLYRACWDYVMLGPEELPL